MLVPVSLQLSDVPREPHLGAEEVPVDSSFFLIIKKKRQKCRCC